MDPKLIMFPIIVAVIAIISTILLMLSFGYDKTPLERRRIQARKFLAENVVKKKIESYAEDKVSKTKQAKIEKLCRMAGFNLKFTDFVLVSIVCSALSLIVLFALTKNILLAILFGVIGALAPYEFMETRKSKRTMLLDSKVGPLLQLLVERYEMYLDIKKSVDATIEDFKGEEPLYTYLVELSSDIDTGKEATEAVTDFAVKTENKYLLRFAEFFSIASTVGNKEAMDLLKDPKRQLDEDNEINISLKKNMQEVKNDSLVVLFGLPVVVLYQIATDPNYITFMTTTVVGKVGSFGITAVFVIFLWIVVKKLGAPIK